MPLPLLTIVLITLSPVVFGQDRLITQSIDAIHHVKEVIRRGHVSYLRQYPASFDSPGYLQQMNVDTGDSFVSGDTLAQLNTTPLDNQRHQIKAQLDFLDNEYLRLKKLLDKEMIAPTELENLEARRRERKAEIAQINYQLNNAQIKADFAGVVVSRNFDAGTYVQPGQPVLTLAPKHDNWVVELYLTNDEMAQLDKDGTFIIEHTREAQEWSTHVHSAALSPMPDSHLYELRLSFDNYPQLLDGTPVDVHVPQPVGQVFKVPHNAILSASGGRAHIMVTSNADEYEKKHLTIADMDQDYVYLIADSPQLNLVVNSWILR